MKKTASLVLMLMFAFSAIYVLSVSFLGILGGFYESRGNIEKAVFFYEKNIKLCPVNAAAYIELGKLYRVMGKPVLSEEAFLEAAQRDPGVSEAYSELGELYDSQERYQDAIIMYRKLLRVEPEDVSAYIELGKLYDLTGRRSGATAMYYKAIETGPGSVRAYNELIGLLTRLDRIDEARTLRDEAKEKGIDLEEGTITGAVISSGTEEPVREGNI